MRCSYAIIVLIFAMTLQTGIAKTATDSFRIHTDLPSLSKDNKLFLDVFYTSDSTFKGLLLIQFFKFETADDSILVLDKRNLAIAFKKGVSKIKVDFSATDTNTGYNTKFYEIIKRTDNVPPGAYKMILSVKNREGVYNAVYLHDIDSMLLPNSPVGEGINKSLAPKSKSFFGIHLRGGSDKLSKVSGNALQNANNKISKAAKKRGLNPVQTERNNKSYFDLYYQDWFAGRYEAQKKQTQSGKNKQISSPGQGMKNDLGSPSLFSQYKKSNQARQDKDETKGEIGLTTNLATGQEQNSGVDNNYYELRGRLETPIGGLPIEIEGLYTSQDMNRLIKSSYFRVHYNVEKMKEGLGKSIQSYNGKFAETKSKGIGMQQIYTSAINNLETQKSNLQIDIMRESGADKIGQGKTGKGMPSANADEINEGSGEEDGDSSNAGQAVNKTKGKAKKLNKAASEKERQLESKRRQVEELDKKITKYKILLDQYKNTSHFDSLLGYSKTKDADNLDNLSYKQLAKKGSNLLPDGQAKGFIAGITSLDAGMFCKDESKYTMSGQMVKGLDFGYDLGFCETGITIGKTEYVGRDGSLDRYTCYSERTTFKPIKNQKITMMYYGYTPDKKMSNDGFFKNPGISAPGFFQPVHIVSANYSGTVSKFITVGGEAAASFKNSDNTNAPKPTGKDKMAYNLHAEGSIPHTNLSLEGSYDRTGRYFENNTLPVSYRGTEQYRIAAKNEFFRSLVIAGIEYDRLAQTNFSGDGSITRWGFDVKTNFKRYPNAAISYKPFTSFHSYTDTLNIPQRQLLGSVWTAKATYQVRQHERSWRFMLLYNSCRTELDTTRYGSSLMQATVIFSDKKMTVTGSIGRSSITGLDSAAMTMPTGTTFLNLAASCNLSKKFTVSAGQDFGVAGFGFCRYAAGIGGMYRMEKVPLTIRLNTRYNTYALKQAASWKEIYSCNIDMVYRFKMKNEKNSY